MSDWPSEAITRDFLEKFIFTIMEPAFTNEFEPAMSPAANNCQVAMPNTAKIG
jgi:hypothetical protein